MVWVRGYVKNNFYYSSVPAKKKNVDSVFTHVTNIARDPENQEKFVLQVRNAKDTRWWSSYVVSFVKILNRN